MKKSIVQKFSIILPVLTIILIVLSFVHESFWIKQMLKKPRYTVAEATTDWHQKNNNGVGTDYKYRVKDKIYFATTNCSYQKGDQFLIIFDSLKPKNAKVLGIYSIENYLIDLKIPIDGWKYEDVPFKINSNTIKKYVQDGNIEPFEYNQE